MLQEGLLFAGRYKFIKQLGRGGFSEVWLADDSLTNVQVAVKVYAPGAGLDENGIKIFTQEFSMVFDMNHTNLLRPTHFDCWEKMPYLIMPLIKNGSAFNYIAEGKSMPEEECWKMLHDVAAGLAYLHEKTPPLIHQDIKPDNILIDDEGRYLITDFGISARVRSTIRGAKSQEQSGGTLAYMGPERFGKTPKPIMASDIWSVGAMMYELMTGTPPFGNHGGMLQKNGAEIPLIEGDYSDDLKNIVTSCLEKETWDRPSARKIEEITYNKLHGIEIPAQPKSAPEPQPIAQPETPTIPETPVSPIPAENQAQPQPTPAAAPQINKSKPLNNGGSNKKMIVGAIAAAVVLIGILIAVFSGGSKEEPAAVAVIEEPRINYDSIARQHIMEAVAIKEGADSILEKHPDEYSDAQKYNKVEEVYAKALGVLDQALTDRDSLSADVSTEALTQRTAILSTLQNIYRNFDASAQYVPEFRTRADFIKPFIKDLLDEEEGNQDNETQE